VLDQRRWTEKHRLNAETLAREREQTMEKRRQQKINAGYVMFVAVQIISLVNSDCMVVFSPFSATACSHASLITGVSLYRTITRVDTVRSRCRGLPMRVRW
jgi:fructose-1,6-bisphosphatase/sedoheptulose 1,7-bisphosphatase-like protein